jgi:DNA topoisomerase-1
MFIMVAVQGIIGLVVDTLDIRTSQTPFGGGVQRTMDAVNPFMTSTLQQAASTRLGLSPSNTMRIAQKLYEAGHITYMRTDSVNLAAPARTSIIAMAQKKYGENYTESHTYTTKSKNAQEAHEAIRPTHIEKETVGGTPEQNKLYELIWRRTIASQMADAKLLKTKIVAETKDKKVPPFAANGSRVIFDGWLKADPAARGEDVELPKVSPGEALDVTDVAIEEKETTPPNRYTEAGLEPTIKNNARAVCRKWGDFFVFGFSDDFCFK